MKNKLISTENITLLLVLIIGILIAVIGYRNDPVITSKTTSDNAVESTELQITKTEESKNNDEVTKSLESESVETNEPSENASIEPRKIPAPKFDLFSIDQSGSATIVGKGLAGESLDIIIDGKVVSKIIPDNNGDFATFLDIGISKTPRSLTLRTTHSDGRVVASEETVLITPILKTGIQEETSTTSASDSASASDGASASDSASASDGASANDSASASESASAIITASSGSSNDEVKLKPTSSTSSSELDSKLSDDSETTDVSIAIVSSKEIRVISPALQNNAPKVLDVIIDAISYDEEGEVLLTGRGIEDQHIRIYVDNKPIKTSSIKADGTWSLDLEEIDAGVYILRIDQLDSDGVVTSRTETPFQKETSDVAIKMAALQNNNNKESSPNLGIGLSTVIIQPGYTLWAVAKKTYGLGMQYVRIYHANKDQIRDPDLIYPGQIFKLPE
ncbi:MAG: LysM peptidoglycan-binding domain-containing protein [Rhodobacteraceae bacterium]|nr:LysM peptidoglycan-binding domain-containing protein [Paracoccaceae bacterium]